MENEFTSSRASPQTGRDWVGSWTLTEMVHNWNALERTARVLRIAVRPCFSTGWKEMDKAQPRGTNLLNYLSIVMKKGWLERLGLHCHHKQYLPWLIIENINYYTQSFIVIFGMDVTDLTCLKQDTTWCCTKDILLHLLGPMKLI